MAYITGLTRDRQEWTPQFIKTIDEETCIGCGRCFKVCTHDVLATRNWMRMIRPRCS